MSNGDKLVQVEYIIACESAPLQVKRFSMGMRYIQPMEARDTEAPTLCALALEHATDDLEKLTGQAVNLEKIELDAFRIFSQRRGFADKWLQISEMTNCDPLRKTLYELDEWTFKGKVFSDIAQRGK